MEAYQAFETQDLQDLAGFKVQILPDPGDPVKIFLGDQTFL
jgi:hypothetical protein